MKQVSETKINEVKEISIQIMIYIYEGTVKAGFY